MSTNQDSRIRPGVGRELTEQVFMIKKAHPDWGVRKIGDALGIPKSNVHRILRNESSAPEVSDAMEREPAELAKAGETNPAPTCKEELGCPADPPAEDPPDQSDPSDVPDIPDLPKEDPMGAAKAIGGVAIIGGVVTAPLWLPPLVKWAQEDAMPWWEKNVNPWWQQTAVPSIMKTLGIATQEQVPVPTETGNLGQAPASRQKKYTVSG